MRPLSIAFIGGRGIPGGWTGFETFVEELAPRLADRGYDVTVYCRERYSQRQPDGWYKGVRQVFTPYLERREAERISHEVTSIFDSLRRPIDIYYVLGTPGAPLYAPLRLTRRLVVINTDGIEWRRAKWTGLGRRWMRFAEWAAARIAADELVADAHEMRRYYLDTYGRDSAYLSNGAHLFTDLNEADLEQWDVQRGGYYLIACRIEPENNVDVIVREFIASGSERELVIAGGMNYQTPFMRSLLGSSEGHRVRFLGPVYGPALVEKLHLGCYAYLHGHQVGGTNPSLLKAMGCGNCAIAFDSPFNAEVLQDTGRLWDREPGSLADVIRWAEAEPDEVRALGARARERVRDHYTWDKVAEDHDRFFRDVASTHRLRGAPPPS